MSKTIRKPKTKRNMEAMAMILANTGKSQVFGDRRNKRSKEKNWKREDYGDDQ